MSDRIRAADPESDRALVTDLLSRNLSPDAGGRRFDWLYLENPHGPARAWVATEDGTGRALGVAAAFPRRLVVDGAVRLGYVLGDFCIDQQHRSLGLALQLQRACLDQLGSSPSFLAYDFPSDRMMAIYRRMHIAPMGQMVRWSKPLRADRQIGKAVKSTALLRVLAAPANKLLEWKDLTFRPSRAWNIGQHQEDCHEEFTELARAIGPRFGTCVERSAEYLNWRYLRHPLVRFEIWTARRGSQLLGYVVLSQTGEDARIVDLFGFSDTAMWKNLMAHVVARLRARRDMTVSASILAAGAWAGLLKNCGFRPRETSPVVVCGTGMAAATNQVSAPAWFLMDGDRES